MLFVGDDWAEDHHDIEIVDDDGQGAGPHDGCPRGSRGSPGCTRWSLRRCLMTGSIATPTRPLPW